MIFPILTLEIRLAHDAVYVRQKGREIAELLGFNDNDQTRIATAVSEVARNAWLHTNGGVVEFCVISGTPQEFQIRVRDSPTKSTEVYTLSQGKYGEEENLAGARSVMDSFTVRTVPGGETVITMGKYFPTYAGIFEAGDRDRIAQELEARQPQTPLEELHQQNQELLRSLNQIREQQNDWERLYREMESTNRDMLTVHDELSDRNVALEQSEARFRLMVDEVKDYAIFLLNGQGDIVTWNIGAEHILGYEEREMLGTPGSRIFLPDDRQQKVPEQELRTAWETGRVENERWYVDKNGTQFWANSVITALWNDDTLIGYVGILRDTTEQKTTRESLQTAYQREQHITQVLQSPLTKAITNEALLGISIATHYEPTLAEADVGGDFFDAFPLLDGRVVLAVGDASGKGLGAALRAMHVKELLRAAFSFVEDSSPAYIVTRLNKYLCAGSEKFESDFDFVTLALVVLDPVSGRGVFLCAGCEPPVIIRLNGGAEPLQLPGTPLGVTAETGYIDSSFVLAPGDILVMVTDGITEARRGKEYLEYAGMVRLAQQGASLPALEDMCTAILEGARRFAEGRFRDDVCMLIARYA